MYDRMEFEWDEYKRHVNLRKHGIDFRRARTIWDSEAIEIEAGGDYGEERFLAFGALDGKVITVTFTWRNGKRRLISARRARQYERDYYDRATR